MRTIDNNELFENLQIFCRGNFGLDDLDFPEKNYPFTFEEVETCYDLKDKFRENTYPLRTILSYEDLAFVQLDNNGDDWLLLKENAAENKFDIENLLHMKELSQNNNNFFEILDDHLAPNLSELEAVEMLKIVKIDVGQEPIVKEIPNTLKALQQEVGGLIQVVEVGADCLAIINEEGKLNGMQPNRWLGDDDIICGAFLICGDGGEDFTSLDDRQIEICMSHYKEIPTFTGQEEELEPRAEVIGFDPMDDFQF